LNSANPHLDRFSLRGKNVLVAGGSGGIGASICRAVAAAGANVFLTGRNRDHWGNLTDELAAFGGKVEAMIVNACDSSAAQSLVEAASERLGRPDVLINCIGTHIEAPAADLTEADWQEVLCVNLTWAFLISQEVARRQIGSGPGKHIHISSVRSMLGIRRGYAAYCASKGGLNMLIRQLATEWGKHGITVNGIAPTFTRTELVKDYLEDPAFYDALVARIPLGRICEPDDVASVALFLASPAADFVTGQIIPLDGGITACQ
jgi:NAD(P)-dependent dehydrogenase (short-subunit alcohol dehydrogenase family)